MQTSNTTLNSNTMNKLHNADKYEHVNVFLNEQDHPVAFGNLVKSLVDSGLTKPEATKEVYSQKPTEMELYYEPEAGLMLVEPGAVESGTIYSPYSGELYKDEDYISPEEFEEFFNDWGQDEQEICCCLGYDQDDDGTAEQLMADGYFWVEKKELWCNKEASGFTERDQEIADYIRNN